MCSIYHIRKVDNIDLPGTMIMKVLKEVNGFKLGINDNPDVAHLDEDQRYMIEEPDGETFVGGVKGITRLFDTLTK
jgi:hypothetical protein